MREIKFRAWYKSETFPLDEDDLMDYEKPQMIYDVQKLYDGMGVNSQLWLGESFGVLLDDEEFEVMQFTGLKDKNGKEIYEGDILGKEGHWSFYVGFKDGCFVMVPCDNVQRLNFTWHPIGQNMIEGWEVIGNIYENKELLNTME